MRAATCDGSQGLVGAVAGARASTVRSSIRIESGMERVAQPRDQKALHA